MSPIEVHQLLVEASAVDNRRVTKLTVQAWIPIIGKYPYDLALEAMRAHFANSTEYLMPAHIVRGVRKLLAERPVQPPAGQRWAVDAIEQGPLPIEGGTGDR
jgi:hypothetical protein